MSNATRFTLFAMLMWTVATAAQEIRISRSELPAAVEATVQKQEGKLKAKAFYKEREHGQTFYEIAMRGDGNKRDLRLDEKGNIVEVEEEVPFAMLPANVKSVLVAEAGSGKIHKIETVTSSGRTHYEATITNEGKTREITIDTNGNVLRE